MVNWLKWLFSRPVHDDPDRERVARLAYTILLLLLGLVVVFSAIASVFSPADLGVMLILSAIVVVVALSLLYVLQRGAIQLVSVLLTTAFFGAITWAILSYQGVRDLAVTGYFVVIVLAGFLLGGRAVVGYALACMAVIVGAYAAEVSGLLPVQIDEVVSPLTLSSLMLMLGLVTLLLSMAVRNIAETFHQVRVSARELEEANRELAASRDVLQLHAREVEQRSTYVEASAEVARVATSILDTRLLASRVVELIQERFNLYYVGLFLLDETEQWAVLRAGTGKAGQAMLARGHRIAMGEGMIGWAIAERRSRIALDAQVDAVRLVQTELPETRSEAALPLRSRGQVVGALTVQDRRPNAFDPDRVVVLQTMADQVAVALDNARLFAESQAALEAERRAYGEISRRAWAEMVRSGVDLGYISNQEGELLAASGTWRSEMIQASETGQKVQNGGASLAIPIKIREHVEGVVRLQKPQEAGPWTADEITLMEDLTEQLEVALESARLYQDTQRRAAEEQLLSEVTSRIRETLDMDTVLQTAIREIGDALDLAEVEVRMGMDRNRPEGR
jgi:GAF domain-containing protein